MAGKPKTRETGKQQENETSSDDSEDYSEAEDDANTPEASIIPGRESPEISAELESSETVRPKAASAAEAVAEAAADAAADAAAEVAAEAAAEATEYLLTEVGKPILTTLKKGLIDQRFIPWLEKKVAKKQPIWSDAKKHYKTSVQENKKIQPFHWAPNYSMKLENHFVDLKMETTDKQQNKIYQDMKLEEIFSSVKGDSKPKRILVQSDGGYGKTTLLAKISNDWHKGESYVAQHFDLVIEYKLRSLPSETTLVEGLKTDYLNKIKKKWSADDLDKMFEKHGEKILILLDGLDEITQIKDVLRGLDDKTSSILTKCTIVVASRPLQLVEKNLKFVEKFVFIRGMSKENQNKFVELFFQDKDKETAEGVKKITRRIFGNHISPLLLILICYLGSQKKLGTYLETVENLKELHNEVTSEQITFYSNELINQMCDKMSNDCVKRKELNLKEKGRRQALIRLGKCCLAYLGSEQVLTTSFLKQQMVEETDLTLALESGILVKTTQEFEKEEDSVFGPVHKLFFEQLAERYLESLEDDVELTNQGDVKALKKYCISKHMQEYYWDLAPENQPKLLTHIFTVFSDFLPSKRLIMFSESEEKRANVCRDWEHLLKLKKIDLKGKRKGSFGYFSPKK